MLQHLNLFMHINNKFNVCMKLFSNRNDDVSSNYTNKNSASYAVKIFFLSTSKEFI